MITHEAIVKVLSVLSNIEKKYEGLPRPSRDRLVLLHFKAILETVEKNYTMIAVREIDTQRNLREACSLLKAAASVLESNDPRPIFDELSALLSRATGETSHDGR